MTHLLPVLFILCNILIVRSNDDPWQNPVEIVDIRNDAISILWNIPEEIENITTRLRPMITVVRSSVPLTKTAVSANIPGDKRTYTFTGLDGNTTYRTSVEAFQNETSVWYASNMATTSLASLQWLAAPTELTLLDKSDSWLDIFWTAPSIPDTGHNAIITQHLVNVYEFSPRTKQVLKKISTTIAVPKTSYRITRLSPNAVYNVTIQAGTNYGYGNMAWAAFSTLGTSNEEHILKCKQKTPNSLSISWPVSWASTSAKLLVKARTLHSPDGVEKEITMSGVSESGRTGEFTLRNLQPGSTYNISINTATSELPRLTSKWTNANSQKTAWGVFSTLSQGEYAVAQARIVVETDNAVSIVFQPLKQLGDVVYQLRYKSKNGSPHVETPAYTEAELVCPKFGCDWMCVLVFNLDRKPREFEFEIRARVDDVWNKWAQIVSRPWNLLERVCSINPPSVPVENVGNHEFQREIELSSATRPLIETDVWRYLVVVDNRDAEYSSIDISKLADKATADIDRIPYYITGSLTPQQVRDNIDFRLGDGVVRGGYLNYPLRDLSNPHWTLVPLSQTENEIMEPRLKTCGFTEEGSFECDMSVLELSSRLPWWTQVTLVLGLVCLSCVLCLMFCLIFQRYCGSTERSGTQESAIMYYHNDSPHTTLTTREFRRVECREFKPSDIEQRMRFLEE